VLAACASPRAVAQVVAAEVVWGFGDGAVAQKIVPLSVLFVNPTDRPLELEVTLQRLMSVQGVGLTFVQPVALSPNSRRWVQFYPYVLEGQEDWLLRWGRGRDEKLELQGPTLTQRATVLLADPYSVRTRTQAPVFDPAIFPPSVAATDALGAVAMDEAPRWDRPRREAFMDWLRGGGVVHLLRDSADAYPVFEGELSPLNNEAKRFSVGAGFVVRQPLRREQMDIGVFADTPGYDQGARPTPVISYTEFDNAVLQTLREVSSPEHNWSAIWGLTALYFVLVGPGVMLVAKRRIDYRLVLTLLVVTVAGFSWLLFRAGHPGYGEGSQMFSVVYAQSLGDDRWDLTSWHDVFTTSGGNLTFSSGEQFAVHTTAQRIDPVSRSQSFAGHGGMSVVRMPVFSNRSLMVRRDATQAPYDVSVHYDADAPAGRPPLAIDLPASLTDGMHDAFVRVGNAVYSLYQTDERDYRCMPPGHDPLGIGNVMNAEVQVGSQSVYLSDHYRGYWREDDTHDADLTFRALARAVIGRELGLVGPYGQGMIDPQAMAPPREQVQVFVVAATPEAFELELNGPVVQRSLTLFHFTLPMPTKETP